MYIFGGCEKAQDASTYFNDLYALDLTKLEWSLLGTSSTHSLTHSPTHSTLHSLYPSLILRFHLLYPSLTLCTDLSVPPRIHHASAFTTRGLVVLGGQSPAGSDLSDFVSLFTTFDDVIGILVQVLGGRGGGKEEEGVSVVC